MTDQQLDLALRIGFFLSLVIYPLLQVWALRRMRGRFKVAAAVPVVPAVMMVVVAIVGSFMGALVWPLMIAVITPILALYLAMLHLIFSIWKKAN